MAASIEILDFISQEKLDHDRVRDIYTPRMNIGKWVKDIRSAAGLNQTQLGEALGVSKGNVSAWENDRHEPSFSQMLRIHQVTGKRLPIPGIEQSVWPFESVSLQQISELDGGQRRELEAVIRTELRHIVGDNSSGKSDAAA